jgi:hypothetical protein
MFPSLPQHAAPERKPAKSLTVRFFFPCGNNAKSPAGKDGAAVAGLNAASMQHSNVIPLNSQHT